MPHEKRVSAMRAQLTLRPAFIRTLPKMHHRSAFHNDICAPLLARVINLIAFAIDCANDKNHRISIEWPGRISHPISLASVRARDV